MRDKRLKIWSPKLTTVWVHKVGLGFLLITCACQPHTKSNFLYLCRLLQLLCCLVTSLSVSKEYLIMQMQDQLHLHAIHFFHRRLFFTIIAKESEFAYMQKHIFDEKYKDFEYHLHLPLGRVNNLRHNNSNSNNLVCISADWTIL